MSKARRQVLSLKGRSPILLTTLTIIVVFFPRPAFHGGLLCIGTEKFPPFCGFDDELVLLFRDNEVRLAGVGGLLWNGAILYGPVLRAKHSHKASACVAITFDNAHGGDTKLRYSLCRGLDIPKAEGDALCHGHFCAGRSLSRDI